MTDANDKLGPSAGHSQAGPAVGIRAGLFLISVSTLLLELLHTRLLSFMMLPSVVYIVITFSMLGFGLSGVALSIFPPSRLREPRRYFSFLALSFVVSAVAGIAILGRFPIEVYSLRSDPAQLALLVVYYLTFTLPYFFSGLCIASIFTTQVQHISRMYFVNLVGSAAGCLLLVFVISTLGGENTLLLAGVLGLTAAFAFAVPGHRGLMASSAVAAGVLLLAMALGGDRFIVLKVDPRKSMGRMLYDAEDPGRTIYTGWSPISRTDFISANWMDEGKELEHVFGIPWPHMWIFTDAEAGTPYYSGIPEEQFGRMRQEEMVMTRWRMLGYLLTDDPDVLIIGVGGGADIFAAKIRGVKNITGVDINPVTIHALKEVLNDYNNDLFNDPDVNVIVAEGRSFVLRSDKKYTNINMNGVDTYNALAAGAYVMAENYLYTAGAMRDFLEHLTDDGMLTITRMAFDVPRETIKLCTALIEAFDETGLGDPADHVILLGEPSSEWATLLCKKSPFTPDQIAVYEAAARAQDFSVYYHPGMVLPDPVPDTLGRNKYFVDLFEAASGGTLASYIANYPFDIRPATDDKPFFYNVHRMRDYFRLGNPEAVHRENIGIFTLVVLLIQTVGTSVVLIVIPLWWFHREGLRIPGRNGYLVYFAGLGLAFMLKELSLIQNLTLYLGHPTYSISIVLATMLLFSGFGSLASGTLDWTHRTVIRRAIGAIVVLMVAYLFLLPWLIQATLHFPFILRVGATVGMIGPLSFFMGMPFPTGLRLITASSDRFVPWAWGVNGIASVIGSVAAIFFAMSFGFTIVLVVGVVCYLCSAVSLSGPAYEG